MSRIDDFIQLAYKLEHDPSERNRLYESARKLKRRYDLTPERLLR